ncbi:MAG: NIPSNAP family protein [Candidatus Solibacter usitatus]|nr:NIPSNAP family protein [Candidatus Solibacter usitatus]
MTRRRSLLAVPAAAAASAAPSASSPAILELRTFQLRNGADGMVQRTSDFLSKSYSPALARAGGKLNGAFSNLIAPNGPFVMALSSFDSMATLDQTLQKMSADGEYRKELEKLESKGGLSYVRVETNLLRAFPSMPSVEVPATDAKRPARVFELRTYESNSPLTLKRKIGMFESGGEIDIFRRVGLQPVFFGEAIAGRQMPNLTYMLCYDSLAAREKNWAAFLADPAWLKLRATPGLSDLEIVSNISNTLLRPLPFSPIR